MRLTIAIQSYHKTFADYFQSPARIPQEPWYIRTSYVNTVIVRHCFTKMEELHFDMCDAVTRPASTEVAIGDNQPHILCACLYWANCLKDAEFSEDVLRYLRVFLFRCLLF